MKAVKKHGVVNNENGDGDDDDDNDKRSNQERKKTHLAWKNGRLSLISSLVWVLNRNFQMD